jgi:dienelactone hydrolase
MNTRDVAYEADGTRMIGYFAVDAQRQGRRPGILVAHSGPGLGDHAKSIARRLAEAGFAAFAVDYHGGGAILPDIADMMARITRHLAQPEVDGTRIGAIGYCFGGTSVLELARSGAAIAATVGFHSGLKTARPQDAGNIKGKVLVCLGTDDPLIQQAERNAFEEEMRGGGVDWQLHLYGGAQHSFTDPAIDALTRQAGLSGMKYHAVADRRSWRSMLELFAEVFAVPG